MCPRHLSRTKSQENSSCAEWVAHSVSNAGQRFSLVPGWVASWRNSAQVPQIVETNIADPQAGVHVRATTPGRRIILDDTAV